MPEFIYCEQRSEKWYEVRRGRPTSSQFDRIVTPKKCEPSKSQADYICELIYEKITGKTVDKRIGNIRAVQYGEEHEPDAIRHFQFQRGLELMPVGFVLSDCKRYGASPDCLVVERPESAEIKCPEPWNHLGNWLRGDIEDGYYPQVQGHMLVTGYRRVHFISYRHDMPAWIKTVDRDQPYINKMEDHIDRFCDLLEREYERALRLGLFFVDDSPAPIPTGGDRAPVLMPPV